MRRARAHYRSVPANRYRCRYRWYSCTLVGTAVLAYTHTACCTRGSPPIVHSAKNFWVAFLKIGLELCVVRPNLT